ncbi:MAG: TOMM precursor leader peptide-binding protein [Myxococcaceae bacterium]|nr:TOMM precursor leader peptide-binding protein [Myxococcaceae bacterium]
MLERPTFKPHLRVVVDARGVFLLSELGETLLTGERERLVASFVDGRRTTDELVETLAGTLSAAGVYHALLRLEQEGYLHEAGAALTPAQAAYWSAAGLEPRAATERLGAARIEVKAPGFVETAPFLAALGAVGLTAVEERGLPVVLVEDYLHPELDSLNQRALEERRPWLLVKPVGAVAWIGPLFRPGKTGCWQCLAQRLRAHREVESFLERHGAPIPPLVSSALPTTLAMASQLAAHELARWIASEEGSSVEGQVLSLDMIGLELRRHVLTRRPQCPACGTPARPPPGALPPPLNLRSRPKHPARAAGQRTLSPEDILQQYSHHVSPITGVVSALERLGKGGEELHTYIGSYPMALASDSLLHLRHSLRQRAYGKGRSDSQARASALCEALERTCGMFRGEEELVRRASYRELGELAISPQVYMGFSERQLATGEDNAPRPFPEELVLDWTPLRSLTSQAIRYLPTACCYFFHPGPDTAYCRADSNGNASGATLEEAILHGLLELVERDAVALWWYNRIRRPAVELSSLDDPFFREQVAFHRGLQRELWVLDITSDFGIPTFAALSRRIDQECEDIVFGFGCHLDPELALSHAVTELQQFLPTVPHGGPDGRTDYRVHDAEALRWWRTATVANQPYLLPDTSAPPRTAASLPRLASEDVREEVWRCIRIAERLGLETYVLDQTRADVGLPVVKVIIPGMRSFWMRRGPGRLYDVPVKQGWLEEPRREDELNPFPVFA